MAHWKWSKSYTALRDKHIYTIDVIDLDEGYICRSFNKSIPEIINRSDEVGVNDNLGLGVMTAAKRDTWAELRCQMIQQKFSQCQIYRYCGRVAFCRLP